MVKSTANNNSKKESCKSKQNQSSETKNFNNITISQKIEVTSDLNSNNVNTNQQKDNQNTLTSIKNGDFHDNTNVCTRKNCNCKKKHISNSINENNQVNSREITSSDPPNSFKKSDNQINIENYISKKNINTIEKRETSDMSDDDLKISDIQNADPTEPDCEEEKKKSVNPNEELKKRRIQSTDYTRKKNQIETNESENCDSNEEENLTIKKSGRKEKSDLQTDYGKNGATSSYLRRTSDDQNESMKSESDLSEEECNTKE